MTVDLDEFATKNKIGPIPDDWKYLMLRFDDDLGVDESALPSRADTEAVALAVEALSGLATVRVNQALVDRAALMTTAAASSDGELRTKYLAEFAFPIGKHLMGLTIALDNIVGLTANDAALEAISLTQAVDLLVQAIDLFGKTAVLDDRNARATIDAWAHLLATELHVENRDPNAAFDEKTHFYIGPNGTLERADFSIGNTVANTVTTGPPMRDANAIVIAGRPMSKEALIASLARMTPVERARALALIKQDRQQAAARSSSGFSLLSCSGALVLVAQVASLAFSLFSSAVNDPTNRVAAAAAVAGAADLGVENVGDLLNWFSRLVTTFTGTFRKSYILDQTLCMPFRDNVCYEVPWLVRQSTLLVEFQPGVLERIKNSASVTLAYHFGGVGASLVNVGLRSEQSHWGTLAVTGAVLLALLYTYARSSRNGSSARDTQQIQRQLETTQQLVSQQQNIMRQIQQQQHALTLRFAPPDADILRLMPAPPQQQRAQDDPLRIRMNL